MNNYSKTNFKSSSGWLDFEYLMRTNSSFRDKIYKSIQNIQSTYKNINKSSKARALYKEAITDYLKISNFNLAPLLPYYYPSYPIGPYTLKDYPFAYCYYTLNIGENTYNVLRGSRQIGKCVCADTKCKLKNKNTGEEIEITAEELFNRAKLKIV